MNYSKTAGKLRAKIGHFSGELLYGLPVAAKRFVHEMNGCRLFRLRGVGYERQA